MTFPSFATLPLTSSLSLSIKVRLLWMRDMVWIISTVQIATWPWTWCLWRAHTPCVEHGLGWLLLHQLLQYWTAKNTNQVKNFRSGSTSSHSLWGRDGAIVGSGRQCPPSPKIQTRYLTSVGVGNTQLTSRHTYNKREKTKKKGVSKPFKNKINK